MTTPRRYARRRAALGVLVFLALLGFASKGCQAHAAQPTTLTDSGVSRWL